MPNLDCIIVGQGIAGSNLAFELLKRGKRLRIIDARRLEISVKDTGRGIEDVARAREPLFTTGGEERSGMGFTIMESFMDKVTVRSAPGKGTRVTMRRRVLPRPAGR